MGSLPIPYWMMQYHRADANCWWWDCGRYELEANSGEMCPVPPKRREKNE